MQGKTKATSKQTQVIKTPKGFAGLKHGGTITLKDGTQFTKSEIRKDPAKVMISIIKQQRSLYSKDMEDWIAARAQAENPIYPMRTLLYNLYEDILIDAFLSGLIENQRILPVKNKSFKILNAAKEHDEAKTELFKKGWVSDLFKWWLESRFWGTSVPYIKTVEFDGKTSWIKELILLDRKHVHPEAHVITIYESDLEGIDYTTDPVCNYVFPAGDPLDLGLLNKAAPLAILKRHSWQNWDQFEEIFGIPMRIAKTASQDPRVQSEIETWLDQMGSAPYGIFPEGTELDIKQSAHTDAFKVFSEKMKFANDELAILICGQTMTSMNGSSRSQGEVHERVMDQINHDDEKFVATLFNEMLIPILRDVHGWPLDVGDHMEWDQPEDLQNLLKIYTGVSQMGYIIDPKQIEEKFGVRIIGMKAPTTPEPDAGNPGDEPGKKEKPEDKPDEELKVSDLVKLHGKITDLYGGMQHV